MTIRKILPFLLALAGCSTNPAVYVDRSLAAQDKAISNARLFKLADAEAGFVEALENEARYDSAVASGEWYPTAEAETRAKEVRQRSTLLLDLVRKARAEADVDGPAYQRLTAALPRPPRRPQKERMVTILALMKEKPPRYLETAGSLTQELAGEGYAEAQYFLGLLYQDGAAFPKDEKLAHEWQRKAARQSHPWACYEVGQDYYDGRRSAAKDPVEGFSLMLKAAEAGVAPAQVRVAMLYMSGEAGPGKQQEATRWITKAADAGDARAIQIRQDWVRAGHIR